MCTVETGVLENMGVALESFDLSFIDSEIRGGSNFTPGCAITKSKTGGTTKDRNQIFIVDGFHKV